MPYTTFKKLSQEVHRLYFHHNAVNDYSTSLKKNKKLHKELKSNAIFFSFGKIRIFCSLQAQIKFNLFTQEKKNKREKSLDK